MIVHVGPRVQATLALGCPGIDLNSVLSADRPARGSDAQGLDEEWSKVRQELASRPVERWISDWRRSAHALGKSHGFDASPEAERALQIRLADRPPHPTTADFPVLDPPPASEGLDALPLWWDEVHGRVALAAVPGGWEVLTLREAGGVGESLGTFRPADDSLVLSEGGHALLEGYLSYLAGRDHLLGAAYQQIADGLEDDLGDSVEGAIRDAGALVLARASLRSRLAGSSPGPLTPSEVAAGIRATDLEVLDRPTLGRVL